GVGLREDRCGLLWPAVGARAARAHHVARRSASPAALRSRRALERQTARTSARGALRGPAPAGGIVVTQGKRPVPSRLRSRSEQTRRVIAGGRGRAIAVVPVSVDVTQGKRPVPSRL